jgi:hypothetical protein
MEWSGDRAFMIESPKGTYIHDELMMDDEIGNTDAIQMQYNTSEMK